MHPLEWIELSIKLYSYFGKVLQFLLIKLNILCYPKNFPLDIITEKETYVHTNACTQIFIVTLLIVVKSWKQPIYSKEYLLSINYTINATTATFSMPYYSMGIESDKIMNDSTRCYYIICRDFVVRSGRKGVKNPQYYVKFESLYI